jgi:hypothetical protein
MVQYQVLLMPNSWLGIGYGSSMTNTDMSVWESNGASSIQNDCYSTTNA